MKNKKWYGINFALILFSFAVTGISIAFMPDRVPMHYNMAGEIDRIGSKYENLLLPGVILLMGCFLIALAKYQAKKQEFRNEKTLLISGAVINGLMNVQFAYMLYQALTYSKNAPVQLSSEIFIQVTCIIVGILLCVLGNVMPKIRMNAAFGLRTTWSMKNERIWQKSQRIGGVTMVLSGFAVILCSIFLKGFLCMAAFLIVTFADLAISLILSYRIYQKDKAAHPEEY